MPLVHTPTQFAQGVRDTLAVLLASKLGTYQWGNDEIPSAPAIRVDDGSLTDPTSPAVFGLEVIIIPVVATSIEPVLRGYREKLGARVVLKQWDTQETIEDVLRLLLDDFDATIEGITRVPRNTHLDTIDTLTLLVSTTTITHY